MRIVIMVLVILTTSVFGQEPPPAPTVFTDSSLGFRYSPPANMRDLTASEQETVRRKAAAFGKTDTLAILLALRSGPDDTTPEWHSVGIETYPRDKLKGFSDRDAILVMSNWVAGGRRESGPPTDVRIGDVQFLISTFQVQEGPLTKYAHVYTAVLQGKLLSFAFAANSSGVLHTIVASMRTFRRLKSK